MTQYQRGRTKEYECKNQLEREGWTCFRMAGSHSSCDIIAINNDVLRLIQVKYTSGQYKISDDDITKFKAIKCPNCTIKEVWTYKKGNSVPSIIQL